MYSVILSVAICLAEATTSSSQDVKVKQESKTMNSLQTVLKQQELYYQPVQYQQMHAQPQYVQLVQKPMYIPQQQPAMIIIAQPALVPANLVYGSPTQQLLNYFHSNPQARYQLLHGAPQPQVQVQHQYIAQPAVASSPTMGNFQIIPAPAHYQTNLVAAVPATQVHIPVAHGTQGQSPVYGGHVAPQQPHQQHSQQQRPLQLDQISHLAQLAANHYANSPGKTVPAIVTGFENFSPEHQAQIKAQLSQHLGTPLTAVSTPSSPASTYQPTQHSTNDFVPSQQIKSDSGTNTGDIMKTSYNTKG